MFQCYFSGMNCILSGLICPSSIAVSIYFVARVGGIKCVKNVTIHTSAILSISAGESWLGIGAADNSMSLFHRPQERLGGLSSSGSRMSGWQLYRTPQRNLAVVCVYFLVIFQNSYTF